MQTAIFNKLTGTTALTDLLPVHDYGDGFTAPSIFDHVPQSFDPSDNSQFPYVRITAPQDTENDTDTELGFTSVVNIHTWSRYRGNKEAGEVMEQIYNALHRQALTATDYGVSGIHQEYSEIMLDPDGITRHGVQRFRIFYEKPTS